MRLFWGLTLELLQKKNAQNCVGTQTVAIFTPTTPLIAPLFSLLVQFFLNAKVGQVIPMLSLDLPIVMELLLYLSRTQCVSKLGQLGCIVPQ